MTPVTLVRFAGFAFLGGACCLAATGCQTTVAGQTLPSAYYLRDDIQFFPAGPEMKLAKEIEALDEYRAQQLSDQTEGLSP